MHISEYSGKKERTIEYLVKSLPLGKDTFSHGYISLDNIYKSVKILEGFAKKLDEYDLWKSYKALCTSGVREALNKYFFIDYIKNNTGIELEILEPSDEIYLKYLGVKQAIPKISAYEEDGILFTNISSGNIFINILKKDKLMLSEAFPYGNLRLTQIFKDVPYQKQHKAYEQDINKMVLTLKNISVKKISIRHMISSGSSIAVLTDMLKPKKDSIDRKDLEAAYSQIKELNFYEITEKFKLREQQVEILIPTLITYLKIMDFAKVKKFLFTRNTFPYSMSLFYSKTIKDPDLYNRFKNTLYHIGEKYSYDKNHSKIVTKFALKLFDNLKTIHSLKQKERKLLEAAAVLHDIGYIIEAKNHEQHSFNIIKTIDFPGISKEFIDMTALIVLMHREKQEIYQNAEHDGNNYLTDKLTGAKNKNQNDYKKPVLDNQFNNNIQNQNQHVNNVNICNNRSVNNKNNNTNYHQNYKNNFGYNFGDYYWDSRAIGIVNADNTNNLLSNFSIEKKLIIYKLASILRIADSMDASHSQFIDDFSVTIDSNCIIIKSLAKKYPYLEYLSFYQKSNLFKLTFGVNIEFETDILF
ncbi:MAG: HD domain-containing protein [Candidatus Acididesulfobacter guangdongensis]|uniref:HD domain-containing protein n=1 Tax=Acididesulfobacter guangdongensis TaxID=2597225 RepID=A0A519BFS6_ACIG2|nr:MAG: HD domain-containing protein [Candidatus Acididesulfobacter guangdongensis]